LDELVSKEKVTICQVHGTISSAVCSKCVLAGVKPVFKTLDLTKLSNERDVIVVDSLTQASVSAMAKSFKGVMDEFDKPEFKNYMSQGFQLDTILTYVQQSELNWVWITHEENLEMEDGKEKLVPLAGTRNFSKRSAKYFDHCIYVSIKNSSHHRSSVGTADSKALVGSRTSIDLSKGASLGLSDLIRSTKGTASEVEAKRKIEAATRVSSDPKVLASQETSIAKEVKPVNPAVQALLDKQRAKTGGVQETDKT
jgi:hypothetical protein